MLFVVAKRHKGKVQNIIRAVGNKHVFGLYRIQRGKLFLESFTDGIGIQIELGNFRSTHSVKHALRGRKRRLVGIQLDILHILRLLTGGICFKLCKFLIDKATHFRYFSSSNRITALFACAPRPSLLAKNSMLRQTLPSASSV